MTEKVKNARSPKSANRASRPAHKLERTTFQTRREMDFFSQKELQTQTGHSVAEWPLVFLKEAIDNALDACEVASIAPVIEVKADPTGIEVRDNGVGLPEKTLRGAMDYSVRVSDKEAYVSPCRGAQGNALKTLLPMPTVLDLEHGRLVLEAHGKRHEIRVTVDPISQRAVFHDDTSDAATTNGTRLRMEWSPRFLRCEETGDRSEDPAWPFNPRHPVCTPLCVGERLVNDHSIESKCWNMVHGFAMFNPHATITIDWFGWKAEYPATNTAWLKWRPDDPTSAHWYEQRHIERLIAAYITHGRDTGTEKLVSEFLAEFDGLSGSIKRGRILAECDLKRTRLTDLVAGSGLDGPRIASLLAAMQRHARPVKSKRLGVIGPDHFRARFNEVGIVPESFQYAKHAAKTGLPCVVETAFGYKADDSVDHRHIFAGANWSMAIDNPFQRFGNTGEGLDTVLADMRATRDQPIVFAVHLSHPRVEWKDRGKSSLVVDGDDAEGEDSK
jgi:hypothetical protein